MVFPAFFLPDAQVAQLDVLGGAPLLEGVPPVPVVAVQLGA